MGNPTPKIALYLQYLCFWYLKLLMIISDVMKEDEIRLMKKSCQTQPKGCSLRIIEDSKEDGFDMVRPYFSQGSGMSKPPVLRSHDF